MSDKKIFTLWLDDSDREQIQKLSDKINLSVGAYIGMIIKQHIEKTKGDK